MNKHKLGGIICLYLVSMASIVSHAHLQDKEIASLIQQFDHPEARVQYSAAWNAALDAQRSLVEIGEPAVPALIMALDHKSPDVRQNTAEVLIDMLAQNNGAINDLSELKPLVPNFNDTPITTSARIEHFTRLNEVITHALIKRLKDDDAQVRSRVVDYFLRSSEISSKALAPEVVSGLTLSLYYGSPFFSRSDALKIRRKITGAARITHALTLQNNDVLHSSEWPLRFGSAIAYGYAIGSRAVFIEDVPHPSKTIKAITSTLIEGLTHPDWQTQEDAIDVLDCLRYYYYHLFDDRAKQALEALPPFGIIFQTIRDKDDVPHLLDSLNTDGITFKFNRSIHRMGTITIKQVSVRGRPVEPGLELGWNIEKSSHSVTITPPKGKNW
ncbi:MAG: HEAT repeat domain-containing protein [Candidatus Poribacteria bacterium]|nr:HEAT repeat domain-containing protein [Candidatus Poribacteria bacterium]